MKTFSIILQFVFCLCAFVNKASAQSYEGERLLLDVEKLTQMKSILSNMEEGYDILTQGYEAVKSISEGNFNLHQLFLDGLLKVSPVVCNYKKVTDIITSQIELTKEYKTAFNRFKQDTNFSPDEITYLGKVYNQLLNSSLRNLDDLTSIITNGMLRMSDDERLERIDALYKDMQDKLGFLRQFNNHTSILSLQRAKENNNVNALQQIYNLK
ncbi:TerB family tellurite resistance protein [Ilyomonas limi]|uniref:TerB family tellurite resistance protein n=1 Tax=Ilyomonas limi TaxID=2575867 RepID=A0A4U3KR11_9BACT|nr:TerB family tellurite resistance protein [Ilyomonas limi]TKK64710.1 TerB family tellurite resistance protein [Ilyomonas limi]